MESLLFYKRNRPSFLIGHHFSPICSVKEDKNTLQTSILAKLNRMNNRAKIDSIKLFDFSKLASVSPFHIVKECLKASAIQYVKDTVVKFIY